MNLHVLATYWHDPDYYWRDWRSYDTIAEAMGTITAFALVFAAAATALALLFFLFQWFEVAEEKTVQEELGKKRAAKAHQELERGRIDKGAWAIALIRTGWDEERARMEYIKVRRETDPCEGCEVAKTCMHGIY